MLTHLILPIFKNFLSLKSNKKGGGKSSPKSMTPNTKQQRRIPWPGSSLPFSGPGFLFFRRDPAVGPEKKLPGRPDTFFFAIGKQSEFSGFNFP